MRVTLNEAENCVIISGNTNKYHVQYILIIVHTIALQCFAA